MKKALTLILFFFTYHLTAQIKSEFIIKNSATHTDLYMNMGSDAVKWKLNTTEVKTFEQPGFYLYNNDMHQFLAIANEAIKPSDVKSEERQKALLLGYMKYETDYFKEKIFKTQKLKTSYEFITLNGRIYLFWYVIMPERNKNFNLQCYINTLVPGKVIGINIPLPSAKEHEHGKELLKEIATTMEYFPEGLPENIE